MPYGTSTRNHIGHLRDVALVSHGLLLSNRIQAFRTYAATKNWYRIKNDKEQAEIKISPESIADGDGCKSQRRNDNDSRLNIVIF